ncbi:MAG: hypothetical protein IM550_07970 [Microcystis sp. M54BS1]|uniref:hypothetical protein n=1 Tax=unclassified Microcystis TaxID=2643300 RepID=UPI00257C0986|nr:MULTISPECIES: hypothetical protein [unclassified Microcystis]MCA2539160.1 hypothetical protein [Microcystis sp. M54BS1]MCA2595651.1 hypothetical protein [Microcystis sp. M38BS1]MCA2610650.1 hypothetical protein [Microcystis sp. M27BS1]MCA2504172.1 hypothetical protein [Microcystis sp. M62BS1]MCA2511534.1 hypothetical protein [Microcystis sp. M60BS1]
MKKAKAIARIPKISAVPRTLLLDFPIIVGIFILKLSGGFVAVSPNVYLPMVARISSPTRSEL